MSDGLNKLPITFDSRKSDKLQILFLEIAIGLMFIGSIFATYFLYRQIHVFVPWFIIVVLVLGVPSFYFLERGKSEIGNKPKEKRVVRIDERGVDFIDGENTRRFKWNEIEGIRKVETGGRSSYLKAQLKTRGQFSDNAPENDLGFSPEFIGPIIYAGMRRWGAASRSLD